MKLTYRGVAYEYTPIPVKMTPGEVGGKYRGVPWRHYQAESIPTMHQNFARLKYRGVAYCIGEPQNIQEREDAVTLQERYAASAHKVNNVFKSRDELTKTHLSNIRKNLERRLQLAKQRGDTNLIDLLEEEAKQIAFG
ncbi:MAG: DUF4278 domain-containing protein [Mastigocoleus sp. MO_167.B18]|uniref:DUF4278 domain-containing protein n=1 Tax=Mastigocoleus sp. MO_188.B34 TaxID=3036635 RepID=UPI00261B5A53|nr:DUF4278 domain-containing protein [Mastigocoleus sp. MO_188.B34]MDJ0694424.1 DUF4278 domain-containing protein [Mastigocoleus sp. MO_188.B34]MDJ0774443.1 DUF4278 domain-containing protein [Mastigocoleus sp. MO_167.B18]